MNAASHPDAVMESDPLLRRLERNAVIACGVAAVLALVLPGAGIPGAIGVLGGGALVAVSYWIIKSSVDALVGAIGPRQSRPPLVWPLVKFAGRYALLGFLAYVMIARLRLHPLGLLAGASSLVAAAAVEALRVVTSSWTPDPPQITARRRGRTSRGAPDG